jgi:hypothetical protein
MKAWLSCLALLILGVSSVASAALGENISSVQTDQVQMRATLRITGAEKYTVHEMQLPSGTTVREYASPSGVVFAVAWAGPYVPDLRQLLGTYFAPYIDAAQVKRTGRNRVAIEQDGLVVHASGHPRAFFGHAYVPQLLPAGVTPDEIQ